MEQTEWNFVTELKWAARLQILKLPNKFEQLITIDLNVMIRPRGVKFRVFRCRISTNEKRNSTV